MLPAPFNEAVARARGHVFQPIFEMESEKIVFDNVALIGDAAFVARPHVGIGVLKGGQDALTLSSALAQHEVIGDALAAYAGARLRYGRNAVRLARYLGRFIERGLATPEAGTDLEIDSELIIRASGRPIEQAERILTQRQRALAGLA